MGIGFRIASYSRVAMKLIFPVVFLAIVVYVGWPYVNLFRLDRALMSNDQQVLFSLIDLDAIREKRKEHIDRQFSSEDHPGGMVTGLVKEGARMMSSATVDSVVTMEWVREKLRWHKDPRVDIYPSIISDTSYAFFESPTIFLVRVGELGLNPVHLRMVFEDWQWQITEMYD